MADYQVKGTNKTKLDPKKLKKLLKLNLKGTEIAERLDVSEATLYRHLRYLKTQASQVKIIDGTELTDLALLGVKARVKLSKLIDTMKPKELIALVDKSFQQRRLLQGRSTGNIAILTDIISEAHKRIKERNLNR